MQYEHMAMALVKCIVEADITLDEKEAIFRAALAHSPKAQLGQSIEFEIMSVMDAAHEWEAARGTTPNA